MERAQVLGEALDVAEQALAVVAEPLVYARADLVRAPDGTLRIIELELIEPNLFLTGNPDGTARFADAFSAAVARLRGTPAAPVC